VTAACFVDPLFSSGVHLAIRCRGNGGRVRVDGAQGHQARRRRRPPSTSACIQRNTSAFTRWPKLFYSSNRTTASYFWEARRILGGDGEDSYTPREDFIRAVAGQPQQGYERAVLAQVNFRRCSSRVSGGRSKSWPPANSA